MCLFSIVGGQGSRARVSLVLRQCIWNVTGVSLVLLAFDDSGSLGFPLRQVIYPPGSMVPPCMTDFHFLAGNRKAELKPIPFSSLLLFRVFLSFLFSCPPSEIVPLIAVYWGYS